MTVIGLFVACLLIYNFEMSGAWYFVAILVSIVDLIVGLIVGSAVVQQGMKHVFNKQPGIRGAVDGGKSNV